MKALHLFIFLLLFITSCEFDYYEKPQYFIEKSNLDYFEFPTSSWWVYEDTVSHKRDSVVLLSSNRIVIEEDEIEFVEEILLQSYQSSLRGEVIGKFSAKSNKYVEWKKNDETSLEELFNYKHYYDDKYTYLPNDSTQKHEIISFIWETNLTLAHKTAYAQGIGLIERDVKNAAWRLVKFHINKK